MEGDRSATRDQENRLGPELSHAVVTPLGAVRILIFNSLQTQRDYNGLKTRLRFRHQLSDCHTTDLWLLTIRSNVGNVTNETRESTQGHRQFMRRSGKGQGTHNKLETVQNERSDRDRLNSPCIPSNQCSFFVTTIVDR